MDICHDCQKEFDECHFNYQDVKLCYDCYKHRRGNKERCYVCDNTIDLPSHKYKFDAYICEICFKKFDGTHSLCDDCLQFVKKVSYYYDGEHELCNECWEKDYERQQTLRRRYIQQQRI